MMSPSNINNEDDNDADDDTDNNDNKTLKYHNDDFCVSRAHECRCLLALIKFLRYESYIFSFRKNMKFLGTIVCVRMPVQVSTCVCGVEIIKLKRNIYFRWEIQNENHFHFLVYFVKTHTKHTRALKTYEMRQKS